MKEKINKFFSQITNWTGRFRKRGRKNVSNPAAENDVVSDDEIETLVKDKLGKLDYDDFMSRIRMDCQNYMSLGYAKDKAQEKARRAVIERMGYTKESILEEHEWRENSHIYTTEVMEAILDSDTEMNFRERFKLEYNNYRTLGYTRKKAEEKTSELMGQYNHKNKNKKKRKDKR